MPAVGCTEMMAHMKSKGDFFAIVNDLITTSDTDWKNKTAINFLEAMVAWIEDSEGYYKNQGIGMNTEKPSWQLFGDVIQAGNAYE